MADKLKKIDRILALDKDPKMALFNLMESTEKEIADLKDSINELKEDVVERIKEDKQALKDEITEIKMTVVPIAESKTGKAGTDGINGKSGIDGKTGKVGDTGKIGLTGVVGKQGVMGLTGIKGLQGEQGLEGIPGQPGFMPKHEIKGTSIRFQSPDGTWGKWMNLQGQEGQRGRHHGGGNLESYIGGDKIGSSQRLYFLAGSGITLTGSDEAGGTGITINSTGGSNFADDETPTGTVNGSNKVFTVANTPITGSLKVFVNGSRMRVTEDYTFSGTTITFTVAPPTNSILLVDYRYA